MYRHAVWCPGVRFVVLYKLAKGATYQQYHILVDFTLTCNAQAVVTMPPLIKSVIFIQSRQQRISINYEMPEFPVSFHLT